MAQLMLVNPRRKKRRGPKRNPRAKTAAAPGAPRRKRRRKLSKRAGSFFRKARKSAGKAARSTRRRVGRALKGGRRSKRKPQSLTKMVTNPMGFVRQTVMPAAIGAAGALALDAAYAYLPIPATIKNGALAPVVKIASIGVLGAAVAHFAPQKMLRPVHTAVAAAITIVAYGFLKTRLQAALPSVRLGEFLEDDTICPIPGVTPLAYNQAGIFMPGMDGVDEYVSEYVSGGDIEDDYSNGGDWDYGGFGYD